MTLRSPGTSDVPMTPPAVCPPGTNLSHLSGPAPTDEQTAILDAYSSGHNLVVEALAGSGKTTTLRMLAALTPNRPSVYVVFNKASQTEAVGKFPPRVQVSTAHSLAYRAVGSRYAHRLPSSRGGSRRVPASVTAQQLGIGGAHLGGKWVKPEQVMRLAAATIATFCQSDNELPNRHHIPDHARFLGPMAEVSEVIMPAAHRLWNDLYDPRGEAYFTHDHYLKIWQTSHPKLPVDCVMFDEAQDANPVIAAIIADQTHAQRIYVGDRNQQLYAWRGAVDALDQLDGVRLPLTRSFRFGPVIAEQANFWLGLLGSEHRVEGAGPDPGRVVSFGDWAVDRPDAYLCRGNGTAIQMILGLQAAGRRVGLAPGDRTAGADIRSFAFAAMDLQRGQGTDHFELSAFRTWRDLLEYVEEEDNTSDLKRMVNIVNSVGASRVVDAIKNLSPRESAEVMVSTAHKAKGLEWDRVKVADDFSPPDEGESHDTAELMLNYVTVTRAKQQIDLGSLAPSLWL